MGEMFGKPPAGECNGYPASISSASSTIGCREAFESRDSIAEPAFGFALSSSIICWAAGSNGELEAGFDKLGSSPALMALAIRSAWYLAYLILDAISGSRGPQICKSSRKVAAA